MLFRSRTPSLYALSNANIGINLSKKDPNIAATRRSWWGNSPLRFDQVMYAALDTLLGFEIARKCCHLAGYNIHVDRLNVVALE